MMKYLTHRDMMVLDINSAFLGVPRQKLMENAGKQVFNAIKERFDLSGLTVAVYCGLGNNGGDGFVTARYLAEAGARVEVVLAGDEEAIKTEEARINYERLKKNKVTVTRSLKGKKWDVVVDALLGTGIRGELREPYNSLVKEINSIEAFKVSVDLPSGLGTSTWVHSDLVITFHRAKEGLKDFNYVVADIGIPPEAETYVGPGDLAVNLGRRNRNAKKGDHGRVLILGGGNEYYGAPILAATAAMYSGVDIVYMLVPEENYDVTRSYYPDFIVRKYHGKRLNEEGVSLALELMEKCDSMVIGPGLGLATTTKKAVLELLKNVDGSIVVDADAIKAFSNIKVKGEVVLTPHPGEFRILTGTEVPHELEEKTEKVRRTANKLGVTILLKGPVDVIASPEGQVKYCSVGNPGMTVGGTGDVLAGLVGGFMAQGLNAFDSACCAAFVNGYAGDALYEEKGYAFNASDLALEIPYSIKRLLEFARS